MDSDRKHYSVDPAHALEVLARNMKYFERHTGISPTDHPRGRDFPSSNDPFDADELDWITKKEGLGKIFEYLYWITMNLHRRIVWLESHLEVSE